MDVQTELTTEEVTEISKIYDKFVLSILSPDDILAKFKPEQRLQGLKPEQIKAYLKKISEDE